MGAAMGILVVGWVWAFTLLVVAWVRYLRLVRELEAFTEHVNEAKRSVAKADETLKRNSYMREGLR